MRTSILAVAGGTLSALAALTLHGVCADYSATVLADGPRAYYRLNDDTARSLINKNLGTIGSAGNATNDLSGIVLSVPGAIAGDPNRAAFFDFTTRTEIPFNAAVNPPNTQPFSIEVWLCPFSDQTASGQSPLANRPWPIALLTAGRIVRAGFSSNANPMPRIWEASRWDGISGCITTWEAVAEWERPR